MAITLILKQEGEIDKQRKEEMLSNLNDTSRIITSLFTISNTGKNFIYPLLDQKFKHLGEKVTSGDLLFGENLGEKNRELKTLESTGKGLKTTNACQSRGAFVKPSTSKTTPTPANPIFLNKADL